MKKILPAIALILASFSTQSFAKPSDIIINFSKVNEGIYRGARLTSIEAAHYLKSINVKTVINLQGGDLSSDIGIIIPWAEPGERPEVIAQEKADVLSAGLSFINVPLNSLEAVTKDEDVEIDQILDIMSIKENQPVFIHCEHGADRTGLLVALFRVKYEGVNVEAARVEWINNGHNKLHRIFTGGLDEYYYAKVKQYKK